jgi:hypothetical protein
VYVLRTVVFAAPGATGSGAAVTSTGSVSARDGLAVDVPVAAPAGPATTSGAAGDTGWRAVDGGVR